MFSFNGKKIVSFFLASSFAITAIASFPAVAGQNDQAGTELDFADVLKLPKTYVETHVSITWGDGQPVVGAKVFDHRKNILLGVTGKNGDLLLTVPNGMLLRLVEPNYGQQQSLRIVQGKKKNDREMMAATGTSPYYAVLAEGWTL